MKRTLQISTKKWVKKKNSSQYSYAKTPKVRSSQLLCVEGFVYVCMSAAGLCFAKLLFKETAKKKNSFVANVKAEKENATKQKQIKKRAERKKQKKKSMKTRSRKAKKKKDKFINKGESANKKKSNNWGLMVMIIMVESRKKKSAWRKKKKENQALKFE